MNDGSYTAVIEFAAEPSTIACSCGDCDWKGTADKLEPIGDAVLTPGDASPAGRCPECDTLAYVDKPAVDAIYCRQSDLDHVTKTGEGTIYVVKGPKPFTDWVAINPDATPIHGELPAVREFQEWLNDRRMADVSSMFHEIVAKYRAAIKDTIRLDYIEQHPDLALRCHKKKWSFIGFTSHPYTVFGRLREALDHAMNGRPGD